MKLFRSHVVTSLVFVSATLANAQTPVSADFAAALQAKLDSCVNAFAVPGISATVLLPGDRYWNGASGLADIYTQEPMDTAFEFQAASMTKLFTSAIVMQLVSEGLLSLDDTVGTFLPPMTYVPSNTKVRHLLKHRSGLTDFLADPNAANSWLLQPNYAWDPFDALETFGAAPSFAQGTAFSYSNTNYVLLGLIVEALTGQPYHEVLRARILDPLGLEHTVFRPDEPLPGPLVPGWSSLSQPNTYTDDMTGFLGINFASMVFTAGAVVTTPWDMAHHNRALFTGALLPQQWMDTMRVCTNVSLGSGCTGYGFGTMRYVFAGRTYFGHAGDINGFTQLSIHSAADSVTLVLSINRNNAPRGPIAAALLGVVFQQLAVGLKEMDHTTGITLRPNPATDEVRIDGPPATPFERIDLLDAAGRTVWSASNVRSAEQVIDVHALAPGAYQVRVLREGRTTVRPLIVE